MTLFVRYSGENRTICVGVDQGGKHAFDKNVTKVVFDLACKHVFEKDDVHIAPMPTRPCPIGCKYHICKGDFQGNEYGTEYLFFSIGDRVEVLTTPEDDVGWMYGRHLETGNAG